VAWSMLRTYSALSFEPTSSSDAPTDARRPEVPLLWSLNQANGAGGSPRCSRRYCGGPTNRTMMIAPAPAIDSPEKCSLGTGDGKQRLLVRPSTLDLHFDMSIDGGR